MLNGLASLQVCIDFGSGRGYAHLKLCSGPSGLVRCLLTCGGSRIKRRAAILPNRGALTAFGERTATSPRVDVFGRRGSRATIETRSLARLGLRLIEARPLARGVIRHGER